MLDNLPYFSRPLSPSTDQCTIYHHVSTRESSSLLLQFTVHVNNCYSINVHYSIRTVTWKWGCSCDLHVINFLCLTCKCFFSTWYVSFDILITNLLLLFTMTITGFSIRAGSRRNSPAIPHELAAYLIEKLPHTLRQTWDTLATKHKPWIGKDLFMKNKRILPEFWVIAAAICVSCSVQIP